MARLLCVYGLGQLGVLVASARVHAANGRRSRPDTDDSRDRDYALLRTLVDDLVACAMNGLGLRLEIAADAAARAALADPDQPRLSSAATRDPATPPC